MKISIRIIQALVGILFIISGLVKANDPLGLSYKMEEFFEIWNSSLTTGGFFAKDLLIGLFNFLHKHSVLLSVSMITLEIVAGIALLLGWRKKLVLYLLLILIVFFTFLTGYAYLSENPDGSPKFTNCGCFGDCLPITPGTSFTKDIVLLVLIILLLLGHKYIQPLFSSRSRSIILLSSVLLTILFQWYALNYLPLVDCLPFKKGNDINEQIKPPKNAIPSIYETRLVYKNIKTGVLKDMSQDEFNSSKIWEDSTWKWSESKTTLVKKGNDDPAIKGFSLTDTSGQDLKDSALSKPVAIIVFALGIENKSDWLDDFKNVVNTAAAKNIPVYFATSNREIFIQFFTENKINVQVYACDFTVIRTAARTNPALYIMKNGRVENKYGYHNFDEATIQIKKL